jgi:mitochondrial fission protein ELM1
VGILSDQDGGKNGMLADYLGRISSTAPGAISLHLSTGAPILPVFMVRQGGPFHRMTVEEPLVIPQEGTEQERLRAGLQAYLKILEKQVRAHPSQWLWLHRRWKSTPEKRILIFDDDKAGHRAQCAGVAERISRAWIRKTASDKRLNGFVPPRPLVSIKTVPVSYRSPAHKTVLSVIAAISGKHPSGGDRWLRWALTPESYQAMASLHADISISCGSSSAPVNRLWAGAIRCKTIQLTKNRVPSWKSFDLAILPSHDFMQQPHRKNLALTDLALAPRRSFSESQISAWRAALGLRGSRTIGWMLGGSVDSLVWTNEQIACVIEQVSRFSERNNAEILVTTSRRTGEAAEAVLEKQLRNNPRCRLLTLVGRNDAGPLKTTSEAVDAILACAQTVVVSGDSISMVSEAVACGKRTAVVFPPDALAGNSKQRRFSARLEQNRKIRTGSPESVSHLLEGNETIALESSKDEVEEFLQGWL